MKKNYEKEREKSFDFLKYFITKNLYYRNTKNFSRFYTILHAVKNKVNYNSKKEEREK